MAAARGAARRRRRSPATSTGASVSRPRPLNSSSSAASGRGSVIPKKPPSLRPSSAWPLRPVFAIGVGVGEVKRRAERPPLVGQQRRDAGRHAAAVGERAAHEPGRARHERVEPDDRAGDRQRVLADDRQPGEQAGQRERPAQAAGRVVRLAAPRPRSRSRQTSANAAKLSSALRTCEKYSVENGSTSVPAPSVIAVAGPVPGASRSAQRATSSEQHDGGQRARRAARAPTSAGASSAIAARASRARSAL